jgi:hypothetical protein
MVAVTDLQIVVKMQESVRNIRSLADLPPLSQKRQDIFSRRDFIITELRIGSGLSHMYHPFRFSCLPQKVMWVLPEQQLR